MFAHTIAIGVRGTLCGSREERGRMSNYVEWLEKSILVMQPDWICDELGGSEWCNENCEKNNDGYLCKECLEHYYEMKGRTE